MTAVLVVAAVLLAQQTPPPAGTGAILGRVTDRDSGAPVAGAVVRAHADDHMRAAQADDDGHYELTGLRAGTYRVVADNPPFQEVWLAGVFGGDERGSPVVLTDDERRQGVDIQLTRAGVLTVRVVDEWGEPLAGVSVTLKRPNSGHPEHVGRERQTDDRGLVRIFPLAAGSYIVCAEPALGWRPAEVRRTRTERLVGACASDDGTGAPRPVPVGSSDSNQVEISLRRSPTYSVSGSVLRASGAPAAQAQVLLRRPRSRGEWALSTRLDAAGRFTFGGVPPGDYAIQAASGMPHDPAGSGFEGAFVPVRIVDAGVDDLTITLRRGTRIRGRVLFEADPPPAAHPKGGAPFYISARLADDLAWRSGPGGFGLVKPDWSFEIMDVFGRRHLELANVPKGWYVKSVTYGDADVTERGFEPKEDGAMIEILMSTRGASIAGSIADGVGNPAARANVIVFAADPVRRLLGGISLVPGGRDGRFTVGPLGAGDYLVVALLSGADPPRNDDVEYLDRLAKDAERVTLYGEETIDLQLRVR